MDGNWLFDILSKVVMVKADARCQAYRRDGCFDRAKASLSNRRVNYVANAI